MNERVGKLVKSAKKNKEFNTGIWAADGNKPPVVFSSSVEETLYAMTYYGWLIAKCGTNWESNCG